VHCTEHYTELNTDERWLSQVVQDNPHRLAAEDSQQGGLQLMKKPGQLLTREQLKAQKVTAQLLAHLIRTTCSKALRSIHDILSSLRISKACKVPLSCRSDNFLDAKRVALSWSGPCRVMLRWAGNGFMTCLYAAKNGNLLLTLFWACRQLN